MQQPLKLPLKDSEVPDGLVPNGIVDIAFVTLTSDRPFAWIYDQ